MAASLPNAKVGAIIVAAGASSRMGAAGDKTLADLAGEPLIARTVDAFERCGAVSCVALVVSERNRNAVAALREAKGWSKALPPVLGGARRQDSVRAGLDALPEDCGWIVVHDGARPFVTPALIEAGIEAAHPTGAAVAVVPAFDTVKRVAPDGGVLETLDRAELRMAQTPQVFRRDVLERAHAEVADDATDDAAMAERVGVEVRTFAGDRGNIKITTAEDLGVVGMPLLYHQPIVYAEIRGAYEMAKLHAREISVIDRGLDQLYEFFRGLPSSVPTGYDDDIRGYANEQMWRVSLANRIFKNLRSARNLIVHCYYEQTLILCRTALEHTLVAYDIENRETLKKLVKQDRFTDRDFRAMAERANDDVKPILDQLTENRKPLHGFVHPSHTFHQFNASDGTLYLPIYPKYNMDSALLSLYCLAFLIKLSLPIFGQMTPGMDEEISQTTRLLDAIRNELLEKLESAP